MGKEKITEKNVQKEAIKYINNKRKDKDKKKEIKNKDKTVYKKVSASRSILLKILLVILVLALIFILMYELKDKFRIGPMMIKENPVLTIETNKGEIKAELYPDKAPNTVKNIIKLCEAGYYDGKIIYGQDPVSIHLGRNPNGTQDNPKTSLIDSNIQEGSDKDYEYSIKGEFGRNDFYQNDLKHDRYILSIGRADYTKIFENLKPQSYNSGNTEILIILNAGHTLDGAYSAFGKVIEGKDLIDEIEKSELVEKREKENAFDLIRYKEPLKIEKARVDTKGVNYGIPKYIKAFNLEEYILRKVESKSGKQQNQEVIIR